MNDIYARQRCPGSSDINASLARERIRPRYRLRTNLQKKGNKSQNGNRCTREPNRLARVGIDSEEISLFPLYPSFRAKKKYA